MGEIERRAGPVEVRYDGRYLTGPAVTYGEVATGPKGPERFEVRSFVSGLDTAALILQHDKASIIAEQPDGLAYTDGPLALDLRALLRPGGAEARLVQRGTLRGLSVGFIALQEHRDDGGRVITRAHLDHTSLVDRPAYAGSTVELRQNAAWWFEAGIPYDKAMQCRCQGPTCDRVQFDPGAFADLGSGGDVLAVGGGGFSNVLGSLKRGTLQVRDTATRLLVGLTEQNTETARRVTESARVAPIYARPILDLEASEYVQEGTLRRFSRASVRAMLIKPTDADEGHIQASIQGVETRRRIWL